MEQSRPDTLELIELGLVHERRGIGPKAHRLAQLTRAGLPVPAGLVVPAAVLKATLGDLNGMSEAECAARAHTAPLPEELRDALAAALVELDQGAGVAVRSAGLSEDAAGASAAGIYETTLACNDPPAVEAALRRCWASLWGSAAQAYADQAPQTRSMSVLVQRMIEPRSAGVLFTSREDAEVWIEAVPGRGEALVSGEADPVRYRLPAEGPLEVEGEPADLLAAGEPDALVELARAAEGALGRGLDLEWAIDAQGDPWLLQARPVTRPLGAGPKRTLWTAANTQEALLDPVTPLTWTLFTPLVERGRSEFFRFAGLREIPGDYMRLFAGRPYFNPDYFRAFLRQIPGAPDNVFDALIFAEGAPSIDFRPREFDGTSLRLLALFVAARVLARERFELFLRWFDAALGRLTLRPLSSLYDAELLELREQATELLESALRRHVLGTAIAGGSYLLLDLFLRHAGSPETATPGLAARLTSGASGNALARSSAALEELARRWARGERRPEDLERFLAEHGHRCEKEAELLEPRWADAPRTVQEVLDQYVAAAERGELTDLRQREVELSERARALAHEVAGQLRRSSWLERLLPLKRLAFGYLLREARRYAPYRENLKDQALRALHLLRRVFLEAGRRLSARGLLSAPEDAFFLELAVLEAGLRGERDDLRELVAAARAERERFLATPAADRVIEVPGQAPRLLPAAVAERGLLEGVGVSSGQVRATARVLSSMDEAARLGAGEVLVARVINAAWTPLFHLAGAVVAEVGGLLSHGAIVAREYGLPAVFGVRGASSIPDGATVVVDGDAGLITIEELP